MESQRTSPVKLALWIMVIIVGCLCIVNIGYSTYTIWRRRDLVQTREETLKRLEKEQTELKNQLSKSMTAGFIEEEARNKLGFAKNGEVIVLLPDQASASSSFQEPVQSLKKPIWRSWVELFVYGG